MVFFICSVVLVKHLSFSYSKVTKFLLVEFCNYDHFLERKKKLFGTVIVSSTN